MATYDYDCGLCGAFQAVRPMAEYELPHECPTCGALAPRALLTAPHLSGMPAGVRNAHARNERSSHEPRRSGGGHGPNCGCCRGGAGAATRAADGAKSFPAKRPWMISH